LYFAFCGWSRATKNLDDGKRFIDLAAALHCPNVRVYPNNFIKGQEKAQTMQLIIEGLVELGDYARGTGVNVLMETHGDLVHIADLKTIMQAANHPRVGLVWDPANMYLVTEESPTLAYQALKPYIHHTHIKDAAKIDGKINFHFWEKGSYPSMKQLTYCIKMATKAIIVLSGRNFGILKLPNLN